MTDGLVIRSAQDSEFRALAEIWDESWKSTNVPSPEHLSLDELTERLRGFVSTGANLFAIEDRGDLIGLIVLDPAREILSQLFLRPAAQNRGMGRACMAFIQSQMAAGFTLSVAEQNHRAIRFYEREGLSRDARKYREDYQRFDVIFRWSP
ncbi:MAG: GNAT family N-acetyltransferase [Pseudomonadota bacterium]